MASIETHRSTAFVPPDHRSVLEQSFRRLDSFVVSESNREACQHVMARASSSRTGGTFVYGPAGCGKTHLMQGVSLTINSSYVSMYEVYTEEYLEDALGLGSGSHDAWIIDDIEACCGARELQGAVYRAFVARLKMGGHIIVACDRSLDDLSISGIGRQLFDLLRTFEAVEINAVDEHLVSQWVSLHFLDQLETAQLSEAQVMRHITECQFASMRALKDALWALMVAAENRPLSEDTIRDVLTAYSSAEPPTDITLAKIADKVCDVFGVSTEELLSKSRLQHIVNARHALCLVARRLTDTSLVALGRYLHRDHTTILHAVRKGSQMCSFDPAFGAKVGEVLISFRP